MVYLRNVHIFLKAGITIEHDDTAETVLFSLLSFIIDLVTFDLWTGRYIRLRYRLHCLRFDLGEYVGEWRNDLRVMWQAWAGQPAWALGCG